MPYIISFPTVDKTEFEPRRSPRCTTIPIRIGLQNRSDSTSVLQLWQSIDLPNPTLVAVTLVETRLQVGERIDGLKQEQTALTRQLQHDQAEMRKLVATTDEQIAARWADLQHRISTAERRVIDSAKN